MFVKILKQFLLQISFFMIFFHGICQGQISSVKIKHTFEKIDNIKRLCVVDSFDRSGRIVLSIGYWSKYYKPTFPVLLNHYEYDEKGQLKNNIVNMKKGVKLLLSIIKELILQL